MKNIKLAALALLAGAGFFTQSAQASLTYNPGDLLIGFRDSAVSGSDYLIDAGPISTILGYTSPTVLPGLGATATNLSSVFSGDSSGWFSSGLATWGVAGVVTQGNNAVVLYAGSSLNSSQISGNSTYNPQSNGNQTTIGASIGSAGADYQNNGTSVGGAPATDQSTGDTESWGFLVTSGGAAFTNFTNFENVVPGAIDLYQIFPTSKNNGLGTPGTTYEGAFTIASNGNITYTPASVPEPSALMALAGGAGLLGLIRRRRAVVA